MPELDDLEKFADVIHYRDPNPGTKYLRVGELHCPRCGGVRRMDMSLKFKTPYKLDPPMLAELHCGECDAIFTAVLYKGPDGDALAVLPSTYGGLTTPHTPTGVGYYLDQAQRAHGVGANSASAAMFRAALEHLLFDQGYKDGMCGKKIADLEAAILAGTAPKWAYDLNDELLRVMKQLGDGAVHPNDGDVEKQKVLDADLIATVKKMFEALLFLIYEAPIRQKEHLAAMKAAIVKK